MAKSQPSSSAFPTPTTQAPIVAVDVGSGYVKAMSHMRDLQRRLSFPSLVAPIDPQVLENFGGDAIPVIEYKNRLWVAGAHLTRIMSADQAQSTLSMEWAGSEGWMVLLLRALFDLGVRGGEVNLITGVPQRAYAERSQELHDLLVGEHRAVIDGTPMQLRILENRPVVMPQAAAGLYCWADIDPSVAKGLVGGIDAGTLTTGYAVLENGQPKIDASSGLDVGMHSIAAILARRIMDHYDLPITNSDAMALLTRPNLYVAGNVIDVSDLIRKAALDAAQPAITRIRTHWQYGGKNMRIGLYGGGAKLFYPAFKDAFPHLEYVGMLDQTADAGAEKTASVRHVSDTRFAPCLGMLAFLSARLGRSADVRVTAQVEPGVDA